MSSTFIKSNIFSPLCFDTLPYETPILFNNFSFYRLIREVYKDTLREIKEKRLRHLLKSEEYFPDLEKEFMYKFYNSWLIPSYLNKEYIPYNYKISKNLDSQRVLSVIHPLSQVQICFFYDKNVERVLFYTNRSNYSLRYPSSKSKKVFFHHEGSLRLFDSDSDFSNSFIKDSFSAKFFSYKKYEFLFSFFESNYFLELEKKYKYFFRFDITKCFENIYTHSISWAIKGIYYSKKHKGRNEAGFESNLDLIMRNSNWGETHGIPVGSEFSRVFAEIILQGIDLNIENKLKNCKLHLVLNKDYVLHRYVDDYFLFTNNKEIEKEIFSICKDCLREYKLFVNDKKIIELQRPFVSNLSIAKSKIYNKARLFCSLFEKKLENLSCQEYSKENQSHNIIFYRESCFEDFYLLSSKGLIDEIRNITCEQGITFHDLSNLILSVFKTNLIKTYEKVKKIECVNTDIINCLYDYIHSILEISFYIFGLSAKANTTYGLCKISYICLEFNRLLKEIINNDNELELVHLYNHKNKEIAQFIYSELSLFMEKFNYHDTPPVEILDIFWILKTISIIDNKFLLPKSKFISFFGLKNHTKKSSLNNDLLSCSEDNKTSIRELSYFEIITIIFYIGINENKDSSKEKSSKRNYSVIWNDILDNIVKTIKSKFMDEDFLKDTEKFLLLYDITSCPYLSKEHKKEILIESTLFTDQKEETRRAKINQLICKFEGRDVFFGWRLPISISTLFWFKDLHKAY